MKIIFSFSKNKEKRKLLDIYSEYQWFIDNKFPIILPKFYNRIYLQSKGNKKLFSREISKELDKVYRSNIYQRKQEIVKATWYNVESSVLAVLKTLKLKVKDRYFCYISLYGPQGQFKYPNTISLRVNSKKDIKEANKTIVHELIHLLILNRVNKMKLKYVQIENIVDLFFVKTDLRNIFPNYDNQSVSKGSKEIFRKIVNN